MDELARLLALGLLATAVPGLMPVLAARLLAKAKG